MSICTQAVVCLWSGWFSRAASSFWHSKQEVSHVVFWFSCSVGSARSSWLDSLPLPTTHPPRSTLFWKSLQRQAVSFSSTNTQSNIYPSLLRTEQAILTGAVKMFIAGFWFLQYCSEPKTEADCIGNIKEFLNGCAALKVEVSVKQWDCLVSSLIFYLAQNRLLWWMETFQSFSKALWEF